MNPWAWIVGALAARGLIKRGLEQMDREPPEPIVEAGTPEPRAELAVVVLLVLAAVAAVGFIVAYALNASTQVLGAALTAAFALLSAALIVTAKRLVVSEDLLEEYPEPHPEESQAVAQIVRESGSRITRKRLLATAAGVAGTSMGVALVTPAVGLGPLFDSRPLYQTPWRRGRMLVDDNGVPLLADDIETKTFYTAFPAGAPQDEMGSPLVVVRLDPASLELPPGRQDWAPEGILAFSKICTHAGCAIALYRAPTFAPTQPRPALVCPCHYSTFDPARGAEVIFGPAGRPLPQLPLTIDAGRRLVAAGTFSGPVGPSWSGVRSKPAI
jgi:ubiquinol-cytochrome c reductase iron-sulfur subunit